MRRREFITLLGGAAATWPFAAHAQQSAMPVVGLLRNTPSASFEYIVTAFRRGLSEEGFVDGRNVGNKYQISKRPERARAFFVLNDRSRDQ
jgi:putative tryptophan/tyrosine transport system substrate-binding protein